jgi:ABC-type arginine transport system permease subunit
MLQRMARLSKAVENGSGLIEAGEAMGLTKGQTVRAWANVRAQLGRQAS